MASRRAAVGVPIGIAAAVVLAVVASVVIGGGSGSGSNPRPLPLSAAGGGSGRNAETAADTKSAAGSFAGGGTTYRFAGEAPSGPDKAEAYRLDEGELKRDDVRRLADVLGLKGEVTTEPDALVIRDGELVLRVSTTPSRMWSYYREIAPTCVTPAAPPGAEPAVGAPDCPADGGGVVGICLEGAESPCNDTPGTTPSRPDQPVSSDGGDAGTTGTDEEKKRTAAGQQQGTTGSGSASSGPSTGSADATAAAEPCPAPPPCPENAKCAAPAIACGEPYQEPSPLPLPPVEVAKATAKKVFEASGFGSLLEMRADRGHDAWYINATFKVGGLEVYGYGAYVNIGPDGEIRDASGSLAAAERLDRYPLVPPAGGLERLNETQAQFRTMIACAPPPGDLVPQPQVDPAVDPAIGCAPPESIEAVVTDVRLGLMYSPVWDNDRERVFLAPAWLFTVQGRDYDDAVIAVTDDYLVEVAQQQPVDGGVPEPALVDPVAPMDKPAPAPVEPAPAQS